ncbi:hypothetical protein F511_15305 [Dorcoceras hygrometricum]|uniref:CUE domain-containing protein n=1 Tax=Dorcoceras hygrometricum TaxID=472368 RepID=A0A2Z7AG58_9LAMI|nr:hypothetical protein F511_15305 [Dorcoceras hygrometricum]
MSAIVCGKRSNFFEESPSSPPVAKRIRCSSSPSRNFSPPRPAALNYLVSDTSSPIDRLFTLFPDMEKQFLEKVLEESGDDLNSAIRRLNELHLSAATITSDITQNINEQFSFQDTSANNVDTIPREQLPAQSNLSVDGTEWVELLVREVAGASNIEDAKVRVSRALESLERSICANATAEAAQSFQKENIILKQQLEAFIHENTILKRAVSIQHERQKEFEEMGQELHQLKQLVSQYQEQLRTLEVNNYALAMHLKQAQQSNSISGRFHPDVF